MSKEIPLPDAQPWRHQLFDFLYKWGMLLTIVALIALFGLASDNFLDPNNIINILRSIAIVTVIAIGVSISLSVGGLTYRSVRLLRWPMPSWSHSLSGTDLAPLGQLS